MKQLLTVLCLVLLSSCSQESEVVTGPFVFKDGIRYDQKTSEPVTGIVEKFYDNGQLEEKGNYKDGERDGLTESYHENGQLSSRENYKDNERPKYTDSALARHLRPLGPGCCLKRIR